VLALDPEGVFLSNGPGDPAATGAYAVPMIRGVLDADLPVFGICLGHQMLALALGAVHGQDEPRPPRREPPGEGPRDRQGRDHVDEPRLHGRQPDPARGVVETHVSLFDGSNCGIRRPPGRGRPVFSSVQYHPEASPGPQDSYYLFERRGSSTPGPRSRPLWDRSASRLHPVQPSSRRW
jgi:carbamoyl-phosphate synthase small subunit